MKAITSILLIVPLIIFASMIGCTNTTSTLVTALNAVSDAASVAVVVTSSLAASGKVSQAVATEVSDYATGVSAAVQTSVAELKTADTNPAKILVISTAFAKVVVPAFGGNDQQIVSVINAVQSAITTFLGQLNSNGVLTAAQQMPTAQVKLTSGDRAMLNQMVKKTAITKQQALKLKAQ